MKGEGFTPKIYHFYNSGYHTQFRYGCKIHDSKIFKVFYPKIKRE